MLAYASIWPRRFPLLCISPYDCSADSDLASYRPKRSASIMPRVSYLENARLLLSFFPYGKYVHPMPQELSQSNIYIHLLFVHPHLQGTIQLSRLRQYRLNSVRTAWRFESRPPVNRWLAQPLKGANTGIAPERGTEV